MSKYSKLAFAAAIAISFASFGSAAQAGSGTLVNVSLIDTDAGMEVRTDRNRAVEGPVSFAGINDSANDTQHEMLILKVKGDDVSYLPYDENTMRIPEDKIASLGEIPEIDAGQGGAITLDLKAGTYLLFCNKPGHYEAGMKTLFYVQ
ncbi:MAG: hypothetical protein JKY92_07530 [Magnetovibrio sp.]|nr:hypothetical protein [Magnetovibrio sp.]